MAVSLSPVQPDRRFFARRIPFDKIVQAVEEVRGEEWDAFAGRHGDWGRDMTFYLARKQSGLSLREIGEKAGGMPYKTVGKAVERFEKKLAENRVLQKIKKQILKEMSNVET